LKVGIRFDVSTAIKRRVFYGVVPFAMLFAAVAHAGLTTFNDGDVLSAANMNSNFADLQSQITALQGQVTTLQSQLAGAGVPAGTIIAYGGPVVPSGWLLCDGSAVSRTMYANLFTAVGTVSGSGDGASTFNLPDLRGRFLRGVDGMAGNDPDSASRTAAAPGGNVGNLVGSVEADSFASHTHLMNRSAAPWGPGGTSVSNIAYDSTSGSIATAATGGNETRPKNAYVNYIIKY
jgi:microcystin-dependent protein